MKASLRLRLIFVICYLVAALLINYFALDSGVLPPSNVSSIWFLGVILTLIQAKWLDQRYYTSVTAALFNSVAVLGVVYGVLNPTAQFSRAHVEIFWILLAILASSSAISATFAIATSRIDHRLLASLSILAKKYATNFGSPIPLLTPLLLVSVYSFNDGAKEVFWPLALWIMLLIEPIDHLYDWVIDAYPILKKTVPSSAFGYLLARQEPGMLEISLGSSNTPPFGSLVGIILPDQKAELAISLTEYRLADERRLRAISFGQPFMRSRIENLKGKIGDVIRINDVQVADRELLNYPIYQQRSRLKGVIVEQSDLETANIEILKDETDFRVGDLVEVPIGNQLVLYQIVGGLTTSENLVQRNRHGTNHAKAQKIGIWDEHNRQFRRVQWLPQMYSPVFAREKVSLGIKSGSLSDSEKEFFRVNIGRIPNTDLGFQVDPSILVTHNTAILGVLGTGKTSLAFELIQRILQKGIKCIVLDITGEYLAALSEYLDENANKKYVECVASKTTVELPKRKIAFESAIYESIKTFMASNNIPLLIFNPLDFRLEIQHPWGAKYSNIVFTPAMLTTIFAEQAFKVCTELGFSNEARLCLVLEEAHTLVPEFNAQINDDEKYASPTTSRAILQGRKYGLGCIVISQRTALVTKSILNQCNTIFALRAYDDTSERFLQNYFGKGYTGVIPTLENRQCVAYGKGVKNSDAPLILELNNRKNFLSSRVLPRVEPKTDEDATE